MPVVAPWRSSYAAVCKTAYTGANPVGASIIFFLSMKTVQLAGCVIKDEAGKVLLIHRNTERLVQWELPGGKLEVGEDLQAAAIREVYEEVGIKVAIQREIGAANFDDNGVSWEYHWFEATILAGTPTIG